LHLRFDSIGLEVEIHPLLAVFGGTQMYVRKSTFILSLLILTSFNTQAEMLTCVFSDPFLAINYNGAMSQVAVMETGTQPEDAGIIPAAQFYLTGEKTSEVQTIDGKTILSLTLTNAAKSANDPNSVYPFEAVYTYPFEKSTAPKSDQSLFKTQKGVCESANLKKKSNQ
jgi:hypothetical protein